MKKNITIALFMIFCSYKIGFTQPTLIAEDLRNKIEFRVDEKLIVSYITSEYEKYPFFFPVNGPSGAALTSMRNSLYPHHTSLFFGCDKVNGGNYWQEGLEIGQIFSIREDIIKAEGPEVILENECIWRRPGADAPIKDKRLIMNGFLHHGLPALTASSPPLLCTGLKTMSLSNLKKAIKLNSGTG